MADIDIFSVIFEPRGVQITYAEERDVGDSAALQRTIMVQGGPVAEQLAEVVELLQEIVDKGLTLLPNYAGDRRTVKRPQDVVSGG